MPQKIYAVLVGIDKYNSAPLSGCVNDIEAVNLSLKNNYNVDELSILKLTDEDAKRESILKAFDHFDKAGNDDTCLFYYCGHGTNLIPPEEFNYEPALQALVCQDWSGKDDGKGFLADKELSYLIWQKTLNKPDLSFVVITDCCHSGTITRDINQVEAEPGVRGIDAVFKSPLINEFAGYGTTLNDNSGYYIQKKPDGTNKLVVSSGKYIHFAAAQDDQKAYEIKTPDDKKRGGFTYFLIDMLDKSKGQVTYEEIYDHVGRSITGYFIGINKMKKQYPSFSLFGAEKNEFIGDRILFTKNQKTTTRTLELYHDGRDNKTNWYIDGGQTDGISTGDEISVEAADSKNVKFTVGEVFRDYSLITSEIANLDKSKRYKISFTKPLQSAIAIHFHETVSASIQQQLMNEWNKNFKDDKFYNVVFITGIDAPAIAPVIKFYQGDNSQYVGFYFDYKDNIFCLYDLSSKSNLPAVVTLDSDELNLLIDNLTKAANWVRLLNFKNKSNAADVASPYDISLKCTNGVNEKGELLFTDRDWRSRQIMKYPAGDTRPAFQLVVTNKFTDSLFVSFAYLSADASVDTTVFNSITIEAGKTMPLMHDTIETIPLANEPEENDAIEFTTEYLKIFISKAKPIPLIAFEQKPLNKNYEGSSRALGFAKVDSSLRDFDWQAEAICFSIQRKPK